MGKRAGWSRVISVIASVLTAFASLDAQAVLINASTSVGGGFRNCIHGQNSACDTTSGLVQSVYCGLPGAASASASSTLAGYGSVSGSAALSGGAGAPALSGSATSTAGTRQNMTSMALQSYTYTGATPTTRTLDATVIYSQLINGTYGPGVGSGVLAGIDIFTLSTSMVDAGTTALSNFNTLFNYTSLPGFSDIAQDQFSDTASNSNGSGSVSVTLNLTPGEIFWVMVIMQTPGVNGGFVTAQMSSNWDNTTGLVPAAVPEPDSIALFGLALAVRGFCYRRNVRTLRS